MLDAIIGMMGMAAVGAVLFARWRSAPIVVLFALAFALGLSMGAGCYKIQLVVGLIAGAGMAVWAAGLCRGAARIVVSIAAVLCFACAVCACQPSASVNTTADQPAISESALAKIEQVEGYVKSIKWIIPLAEGVIALFAPELVPTFGMAVASYNALTATADSLIAAYKGDAASVDATKFTTLLMDLKNAWRVLDGAYKADTAALTAATTS